MQKFILEDFKHLLQGFEPSVLKMWIQRGFIELEDLKPGPGTPRQFSWPEVILVAAMWQLAASGHGPSINAPIAQIIARRASTKPMHEWVAGSKYDEERQCVLFYRLNRDGTLAEFAFVPKIEVRHEILSMYGCYYDADYLLYRFADELMTKHE